MNARLVVGAVLLAAALHAVASLGNPVGLIEDDSIQVLLARSLRHGAFALPDASGVPISDPLPGLALILLLPAWLCEPSWGWLRLVSLGSLAAAVVFAFRLGRRLLPRPWPLAAAGLTALTPALARHAGFVLPDIPFLALSLAALDLGTDPRPQAAAVGASAAGLAALVRPQGAFLIAAMILGAAASGESARKRWRRAALLAAAFLPLAAWIARNKLLAGVSTGYAVNWRSQVALLGEPGAQARHAAGIVASFFGAGMAGLGGSWSAAFAAGGVLLGLAALGAASLIRRPGGEPRLACSMAVYAALLLMLHMTWLPEDSRYVIPLSAVIWLFALSAARSSRSARAAVLALAAACLWRDVGIAAASARRTTSYQPATMAWIRANTTADARMQSLKFNTLTLLTGRPALPPALGVDGPRPWLDDARARGAAFLHVEKRFRPGGFVPAGVGLMGASIEGWARAAPEASLVYENDAEGSLIFSLGRAPGRR